MKIRTKMAVVFVSLAAILALPALFAASRLSVLRDIAVDQGERNAQASLALGRFQAALSELDRVTRSYLVAPDAATGAAVRGSLGDMDAQIVALASYGYADAARLPRARLDSLRISASQLQRLVQQDRLAQATRAFGAMRALLGRTQGSLGDLASEIDRRRNVDLASAREVSDTAASSTMLGVIIAVVVALLIAAWASESLVGPINRLATAMAGVADGAFVVPDGLALEQRDEIGELSRSFHWMTRRLAEFDKMRAEFVAVASHELKSPIHIIGGYVELLSNEMSANTGKRHRDFVELIGDQVRTATRLLNRLLDISRLEARGFNLCPEEVSLEYLFASVNQWLGPAAGRKRVHLGWEVDPSAPATISADFDLLRSEVLGNLVSNAIKFTPSGGHVTVRAAPAAAGVRIEVADTGVGIPSHHLPYVFEKYYQVGRRARRAGSGLGLAIAKQAVEAHEGTLTVASMPGEGTVFSVILPLRAAAPDTERADDSRRPVRAALVRAS